MKYNKISVLVPTRKRPGYLQKMLDSYRETMDDASRVEFVFRCDKDDIESVQFLSGNDWPIIVGPRRAGYRSLPSFYNDMVRIATGDVYMCGNDDMVFRTKGWPQRILLEANKYPDGVFNIGVDTGLNDEKFPFSIVSRELVEAMGYINDERLLFSDIFLLDVAKHFDRAVRVRDVMIYHDWAGHGADETRRDANRHEFDMVFADASGSWTERYRAAHEGAVAEAVAKIQGSRHMRANAVLGAFERYEPLPAGDTPRLWPPTDRPVNWNARTGRDRIHYDRAAMAQLVNLLDDLRIRRGTVLLSELGNGLPAVLWGHLFDSVYAVVSLGEPGKFDTDGKHTLAYGAVGDTKFLYRLLDRVQALDVMVLDDNRYAALISPYFLLHRALRRPGLVLFVRGEPASAEDAGPARFIDDLRSGALDGICHSVRDISADGIARFSYELFD